MATAFVSRPGPQARTRRTPIAQGRGIGTKLLEPVLREATGDGLACYLEASHEQNVPLYERHGSTILSEVHLPKSGPVVKAMRRDASASS